MIEQKYLTFKGEKIKFKRAKQPANMKWENRGVGKKKRNFCIVLALIFMGIFGTGYFYIATLGMNVSILYMTIK